jgi:hypothetical protein
MAKNIATDAKDNPTDSEVKETICYGRHLDEFFIKENQINEDS